MTVSRVENELARRELRRVELARLCHHRVSFSFAVDTSFLPESHERPLRRKKHTHQGPCLGLGMSTTTFQQVSFEGLLGPNRFQLSGPPCRGTGWTVQGAKRGGLRARNSALLSPVDARKGRAEPETKCKEHVTLVRSSGMFRV